MLQRLLNGRLGAAASRLSWAAIAQIGKVAIQFGGLVIMTRLLPVADFGLIALAALFTNFALLLQDMGTSAALIQRKDLSQELISTVFWLNVLVGVGFCVILSALSPIAAFAFDEPRLQNVLIALAMVFPLLPISTVPMALLQRSGRMRRVALVELSSASIALAVGIIAAKNGYGVYSLVIQQGVGGALLAGQLWLSSERYPAFQWSQAEMKRTWAFTGHLVAFNSVNYFARNADNMLIGRFLGTTALAHYSVAYRFITAPNQFLGSVSNRVLLPIYSQRQDEPSRIGTHFIKTLALISLFCAPGMAILWGLRQPFVTVLLGPDWLPVVEILSWFAPVGFIQAIASNVGLVLVALGKTRLLRNIAVINTVIILTVFFICVRYGVVAVAAGYFFANVVLCTIMLHVTLRLVDQSLLSLLKGIWRQTLSSCAIGLAIWLAAESSWFAGATPLLLLLTLVPLGGLLYLGFLLVFARDLLHLLRAGLRQ
jgi:PST family polysaccharide transporter